MTPGAILERLTAQGIRLKRDGMDLIVTPWAALTDELRGLIREHKPELLDALARDPGPIAEAFHARSNRPDGESTSTCRNDTAIEPTPSPLTGLDCNGCNHHEMRDEWHTGTRKRFWWRCNKGHELLEIRRYGERITLSPPECEEADDFEPWKPGTK